MLNILLPFTDWQHEDEESSFQCFHFKLFLLLKYPLKVQSISSRYSFDVISAFYHSITVFLPIPVFYPASNYPNFSLILISLVIYWFIFLYTSCLCFHLGTYWIIYWLRYVQYFIYLSSYLFLCWIHFPIGFIYYLDSL